VLRGGRKGEGGGGKIAIGDSRDSAKRRRLLWSFKGDAGGAGETGGWGRDDEDRGVGVDWAD